MTLTLPDRLTGLPTAVTSLLPGRWCVSENALSLKANGARAQSGDRLTPSRSSRAWRLGPHGGAADPDLVPDDDTVQAVFDVATSWFRTVEHGLGWDVLVGTPSLDPSLSLTAGLLPFETRVLAGVVHLQEVCWDPRDQLSTVVERLPAYRVRRAAPDAERHLATHSEDWANRSPVRILPKRLLALVPVENLDLYENRVAVRLRDRLDRHCAVRIRRLSRLLKEAEALADYSSDVRGSYRLRERVAHLWAEASHGDDPSARVLSLKTTIAQLQGLRRKLVHLRDSPLYQGVPRTARISGPLEVTNLLTEHEHYREVGALWRDISSREREDALDPQQHHDRWQSLCRAFDAFVGLLLVRTLHEFGYRPAEPFAPHPGAAPTALSGPRGPLTLLFRPDGTLSLARPSGDELRLVPIPAALDTADSVPLREYADLLVPGRGAREAATVTVYLSNGRGDGTRTEDLPGAAIGVSPSLLLSGERLARIVQSWLVGSAFSAYPPVIDVPPAFAPEVGSGPDGWETGMHRFARLRRPLLRAEEEDLLRRLDLLVLKSTDRGERNDRQGALGRLTSALKAAASTLQTLRVCPVCGTVAPREAFTARENDCFRCSCSACEAVWGLNASGDSRPPYPFLDTPSVRELARGGGDDVDREVGRDALAVPRERNGDIEWCHPSSS